MATLRDLAHIANNARGDEAKEVYRILRNLLAIVKANLRVDRSITELESKQPDETLGAKEMVTPAPAVTTMPVPAYHNHILEIPPIMSVENPPAPAPSIPLPAPAKAPLPPKVPAKKPVNKSPKEAVTESISRLLHLPQPEKPDEKPLLPVPFELVITDEELPANTFLAAPFRQERAREEVLGILDSFIVMGWGACAECSKDLCIECKGGGIRVKMNFDTVTGATFTGTAWKNQIALLLRCSVNRLIEVWVERPEEINARLSEYLGRPFHVAGTVKDFQGLTYSVNALTCLHWGAITTSLTERATNNGGEVS